MFKLQRYKGEAFGGELSIDFIIHGIGMITGLLIISVQQMSCTKQQPTINWGEPHTSVTGLSMCVCIYVCWDQPLTVNVK